MISYASAKKYCKDPIYEIENFREAEADTTTVWDLHHRDEIDKSMKKS